MSLYNIKSLDGQFSITKFDGDLNPEANYVVSETDCTCPAGHRPTCRHRQMLPVFLSCDAVDQAVYWDHEAGEWLRLEDSDIMMEAETEEPSTASDFAYEIQGENPPLPLDQQQASLPPIPARRPVNPLRRI